MKHFVVDIGYTVPIERIDEVLAEHRAFLQGGYESGMLLMSGGRNPRTGGIIVARAETREAIEAFFANDPYRLHNVATHNVIEFNPVKRQDFIVDWVEGR